MKDVSETLVSEASIKRCLLPGFGLLHQRKGEEIKRNAAHSSAVQIKNGARSEQTV